MCINTATLSFDSLLFSGLVPSFLLLSFNCLISSDRALYHGSLAPSAHHSRTIGSKFQIPERCHLEVHCVLQLLGLSICVVFVHAIFNCVVFLACVAFGILVCFVWVYAL